MSFVESIKKHLTRKIASKLAVKTSSELKGIKFTKFVDFM